MGSHDAPYDIHISSWVQILKHHRIKIIQINHFGKGFARRTFFRRGGRPSNRNDGDDSMVGGVITSTILELIIYPAIFMIWRGRSIAKA